MRAIVLTAYGDASKLELVRLPHLKPGPNQVKVRMAGAGINPLDWKLRSGVLHATMLRGRATPSINRVEK